MPARCGWHRGSRPLYLNMRRLASACIGVSAFAFWIVNHQKGNDALALPAGVQVNGAAIASTASRSVFFARFAPCSPITFE